jgi:hypothetical protein
MTAPRRGYWYAAITTGIYRRWGMPVENPYRSPMMLTRRAATAVPRIAMFQKRLRLVAMAVIFIEEPPVSCVPAAIFGYCRRTYMSIVIKKPAMNGIFVYSG